MEASWIVGSIWVLVGVISAAVDLYRLDNRPSSRPHGYFEVLFVIVLNLILGPAFFATRLLFDRLPYALGWCFGYLAGRTGDGFKDGKNAGSDH